MPVGAGKTLTNSDSQSSQTAIAAINSVPVRPVSSSIMDFNVTNGRSTLLFASGVQSKSFPASSSWRLTYLLVLGQIFIHGDSPARSQTIFSLIDSTIRASSSALWRC